MAKPIETLHRDGSGRILIDATKDLTITLRAEDGKTAVQCDQGHCAFAEAAKREMPGLVEVRIGRAFARFCFPEHVVRYRVSSSMRKQIIHFDETREFEFGDYSLLAVAPCDALGAPRSAARAATGPHETKARPPRVVSARPTTWSFNNVKTKASKSRPGARGKKSTAA